MKFVFILLLFPFSLFAQQSEFTKIIEQPNIKALTLYEKSIEFTKTQLDDFYFTEGVKNKKWALGRAKWGSASKKALLGYDYSIEENKTVVAHCLWAFEVGAGDGCIKLLTVTGDVTIRCKDDKVKLDINNLRYCHYNRDAPPSIKPIGYGKKIKAYGEYADLLKELNNKEICPSTLSKMAAFVDKSVNDLYASYQEYLKEHANDKGENW